MTAKCAATSRIIRAAFAIAAFVTALPSPGSAAPEASAQATAVRSIRAPDSVAPRSTLAPTRQSISSHNAEVSDTAGRPWSIEDALPRNSKAIDTRTPDAQAGASPGLGRVPLRNGPGTFGFETETKLKSNEFSTARTAPGIDSSAERPPTYLGLSLSVPTNNKSIIPAPLLPPWVRPE